MITSIFPLMIVVSAIILNEKKIEDKEDEEKEEILQMSNTENSCTIDSSYMDKQETRSRGISGVSPQGCLLGECLLSPQCLLRVCPLDATHWS